MALSEGGLYSPALADDKTDSCGRLPGLSGYNPLDIGGSFSFISPSLSLSLCVSGVNDA